MPKEKRASSSSVNATTSSGRSVWMPRSFMVWRASTAPSTPRGPSKSPPSRTESACEPARTTGASSSLALATADEVAGGVLAHLQARLAHVGGDEVFGGPLFSRKGEPVDATVFGLPDSCQLVEARPETLGVNLPRGATRHSLRPSGVGRGHLLRRWPRTEERRPPSANGRGS